MRIKAVARWIRECWSLVTNGGDRNGRGSPEPEQATTGASGSSRIERRKVRSGASVGLTDRSGGSIWSGLTSGFARGVGPSRLGPLGQPSKSLVAANLFVLW
jgi:hypothetical protein